jgi:hypothetical protein
VKSTNGEFLLPAQPKFRVKVYIEIFAGARISSRDYFNLDESRQRPFARF